VTGAASGIGLQIARRLAEDGAHVLLADRNPSVVTVEGDMRREGLDVSSIAVDLQHAGDTRRLAERALHALGGACDILVNCAGIHPKRDGRYMKTSEVSLEDWEQVLRVNMTAPFLLCQSLIPPMCQKGWGRVVNIASRVGRTFTGTAGLHYTASKAALLGMTRQLAGESAAFGVTVNCVAPGRIETPLLRQASADVVAATARTIPAGRLGTPSEIAAVVRYLVSDGAAFMSGACVDANGGDFMG
jgi:3-oxoacyl-[acyl-carrier protein] reductase